MLEKLFNLSGRTALVTGGGKGLGLVIAQTLAEAGAKVIIAGRHEETLRSACAEIEGAGDRVAEYIVADLSQKDESDRLAQAAIAKAGKIDILVNNAGTNTPQAVDEITDSVWESLLELNLSSCMRLTRALVPGMKQQRWGRIIHISSIMGLASKEGRAAYSATKAALIGMTRAAALELGPYKITVNSIAPGPFLTDLPRSVFSQAELDVIAARLALQRWGTPTELAGPVLLLASDAGSYITGSALVVDGGALIRTM
jgi:NAD(P)-dependent dehydrogenase (short-subunit alcohol dehydrogenase family)